MVTHIEQGKSNSNKHGVVDKLKRERDRFVAFAFASADILMEIDKDGVVRFADGSVLKLLGKQPEEIVGKNFNDIIHEDDLDLADHFLGPDSGMRIDNVNIRLMTKTSSSFPFLMSGYRISELQGHFYLTFSTFRSDLNLSDISRRDLDTGLLRRGEFSLAANKQLILSKFSEKVPLMTMLVIENLPNIEADADDVKRIVREIGDSAKALSINQDTAGLISPNIIGLVHHDDISGNRIIAEIKAVLEQVIPYAKQVEINHVTVNLEAETEITEEDSAQAILFTIDKFTETKGRGFQFDTLAKSYEQMVYSTVEKIAEFRQTVEDELFDLAFQPIVEIKTGLISHFEVLTRLRDASKFSNPFQFIEFGENVGMIKEFDFKMVCRSLDTLKEMKSAGYSPSLAINLSGYSLSSTLFMDKLINLLEKNKEFCPQMSFEVTESARVMDIKRTNEYFAKLRSLGSKCSIDDFGTGEATFEYLRNLEVDVVKIDGSYISEEALNSPHGKHLLQAIGNLCKDMGVEVIGEKVEDIRGAKMLEECGIRYAQGYFYSKPEVNKDILKQEEIVKESAKVMSLQDYKKAQNSDNS